MPPRGPPGDVGSIEVLKDMPRQDEALDLLKKLHSITKPIAKRHGWYLPVLTEFFPENPGLLGMNQNHGQKIYIRLRPYHAKDTFYDLEQDLVGTMLHEYTHNVRGPHDEIFYKTLDGLNKEYDELRAKGYSGEGFLSNGNRLGVSHNLSPHEARAKAIAEAERRQKLAKVMGPAGGRTLGGTTAKGKSAFKSPRELMLEAAERRARDAKSCGHGGALSMDEVAKELEKATKQSVSHTVENHDLPPEFEEEPPPIAGKRTRTPTPRTESEDSDIEIIEQPVCRSGPSKAAASMSTKQTTAAGSSRTAPRKATSSSSTTQKKPTSGSNQHLHDFWACEVCTYENRKLAALACEVCGSERSSTDADWREAAGWQQVDDVREIATDGAYGKITHNKRGKFGWICHVCTTETEREFWTCRRCGIMKLDS